ncbi:hypothetical protein CY652_05260 [Burkholderia sp. WAC0059]|uniref:hypothetical protein n=1 Tax=Burkholderia sp. WAC0059 TaxID=2066022 RepID=UPI000C7EA7D7|nr:hypothetical protein [Burkholderia sp. WAC0059]PLZ03228.1 hypothetical protein CY652_05260 [Burkholderia sp. WAC0059]
MSTSPYLDLAALTELASRSEAVAEPCSCTKTPLDGWQSQPLSLPESQLREVGTLLADAGEEPTFSEYLLDGARYWSPEAPIAPRYFPYNRCAVWECAVCGRGFLRYTEGGGYFVDRRIRLLKASLIVDAAL